MFVWFFVTVDTRLSCDNSLSLSIFLKVSCSQLFPSLYFTVFFAFLPTPFSFSPGAGPPRSRLSQSSLPTAKSKTFSDLRPSHPSLSPSSWCRFRSHTTSTFPAVLCSSWATLSISSHSLPQNLKFHNTLLWSYFLVHNSTRSELSLQSIAKSALLLIGLYGLIDQQVPNNLYATTMTILFADWLNRTSSWFLDWHSNL